MDANWNGGELNRKNYGVMVEWKAWSLFHLLWLICYPKIHLESHELAVEWINLMKLFTLKKVLNMSLVLRSALMSICSLLLGLNDDSTLRSMPRVFHSVHIMKLLKLGCFPMALSFETAGVWGAHRHSTGLINISTYELQGLSCFSQLGVDALDAKV